MLNQQLECPDCLRAELEKQSDLEARLQWPEAESYRVSIPSFQRSRLDDVSIGHQTVRLSIFMGRATADPEAESADQAHGRLSGAWVTHALLR